MNIGGYQPVTLSDFPGRTAAIVFAQGCNFRCPFCHNGALLPMTTKGESAWDEAEILRLLDGRRGKFSGVVITGGEPTLQLDLPSFIRHIRAMKLKVKLDTNGSKPTTLAHLIRERLVDYIAMDIKAPWYRYAELAGTQVDTDQIARSMGLIARCGIRHEFRTTVVEPLLTSGDVAAVAAMIPAGSPHTLQTFRPEQALDPALRHGKEVTV